MAPIAIRFQFDEHVPHAIAHALTSHGIDVATANSSGTVGLREDRLLAHCLEEGRVLVTHDRDYLRLDSQGQAHAGIVYCAQGKFAIGELIDYLLRMATTLSPAAMAGRVAFVRRSALDVP